MNISRPFVIRLLWSTGLIAVVLTSSVLITRQIIKNQPRITFVDEQARSQVTDIRHDLQSLNQNMQTLLGGERGSLPATRLDNVSIDFLKDMIQEHVLKTTTSKEGSNIIVKPFSGGLFIESFRVPVSLWDKSKKSFSWAPEHYSLSEPWVLMLDKADYGIKTSIATILTYENVKTPSQPICSPSDASDVQAAVGYFMDRYPDDKFPKNPCDRIEVGKPLYQFASEHFDGFIHATTSDVIKAYIYRRKDNETTDFEVAAALVMSNRTSDNASVITWSVIPSYNGYDARKLSPTEQVESTQEINQLIGDFKEHAVPFVGPCGYGCGY